MNKILKILGALILIYIVVFTCNKFTSQKLEENINESPVMEQVKAIVEIEQTTKMMNANLPKSIDSNTTATKVEYDDNKNVLTFYYEVTGVTKEQIKAELESLKSSQINFIKNNPNNITYLKAKVMFKYIYSDSNGIELASYTILSNEYLN